MWLLAAVGTAFCFGVNNTLFKWGTTKGLSKTIIQFFFYLTAFCLVTGYALFSHSLHLGILSSILGGIMGILNTTGNLEMTKAFEKGPASVTSTLIAMNTIVVVFATAMFFPESIPLMHWVGIILMLTAAVIIQYKPGSSAAGGSTQMEYKPWLLHTALSILSLGSVGFLMKVASYLHFDFLNLLVSMYGGGLLFLSFLVYKEFARGIGFKEEVKVAVSVGFFSTVGFSCYLFALGSGPSSVVFPVVSLSCLVVAFSGLLIFKERLRILQVLGIGTAIFGLILTKI